MTTKTIYTAGYGAGWTPETLDAALRQRGAVLVDTRFRPWSQSPKWRWSSLWDRLGDSRYTHLPAFGNRNYKGGPIELVDPEDGLRGLAALLNLPGVDAVVLLCGCRDVHTCHRKVVADLAVERLADRWTMAMEHLWPETPYLGQWKCLSIRQPWAWAILHAGKDIENRVWGTTYRGPILIHAGLGMTTAAYGEASSFIQERIGGHVAIPAMEELRRGGIIGAARIVDCVARSDSRWYTGTFGFVLTDPQPLPFLEMKGRLGLFDVEKSDLEPIAAKVAALKWSSGKSVEASF